MTGLSFLWALRVLVRLCDVFLVGSIFLTLVLSNNYNAAARPHPANKVYHYALALARLSSKLWACSALWPASMIGVDPMEERLIEIGRWFDRYVEAFYSQDPYIDPNLRCKQSHSRRVADLSGWLAVELNLQPATCQLVRLAGLLHDIGRFEQFVRHRTFMDGISIDHGAYGLQVIARYKLLEPLDKQDHKVVMAAIQYHNKAKIPSHITGQERLVTQIVRDCDKLDIYRIVVDHYKGQAKDDLIDLGISLPDGSSCNPAVLEAVCTGKAVHYSDVHNLNDLKLMQLAWVYDINFQPAIVRLVQDRYIEAIASTIPKGPASTKAVQTVLKYIRTRLDGKKTQHQQQ